MTGRRLDADQLIDLAVETLKRDVLTAVGPEQRYAGAMIVNALEIARRALPGEIEAAEWALLDSIYEEGEGTMRGLALDVRAGTLPGGNGGELRAGLKRLLAVELGVKNPRFLKARHGNAEAI